MSELKLRCTTRAYSPRMPSTETQNREIFSVASVNAYCDFHYFIFPTDTGAFPLDPSCECHSLVPPIWLQLCTKSDFTIRPGWGSNLLSPVLPYPDVSPTLIFCGPCALSFCCINFLGRRLIVQGIGAHKSTQYDVQWQPLRVCNQFRDVLKSTEINHYIFKRLGRVTV